MKTAVWRITGESEATLLKEGVVILRTKTTSFEETPFSPDYFLPDEKIVQFFAQYPGMWIFRKKACRVLDFIYPKGREEYIASSKEALIRFSNIIQDYACRIVISDKPLRKIAEGNSFSNEFREYVGKGYHQKLFPWMKDIEKSNESKEFEYLFIEQLREQIQRNKYTFWIKLDSEIRPVYLLVEWDALVLATPSYCILDDFNQSGNFI